MSVNIHSLILCVVQRSICCISPSKLVLSSAINYMTIIMIVYHKCLLERHKFYTSEIHEPNAPHTPHTASHNTPVHLNSLKEGNVLFNNALNTFYLWLYGIRHMVKDNSDSEGGNPLLALHGLHFLISSKGYFICTIPQTG